MVGRGSQKSTTSPRRNKCIPPRRNIVFSAAEFTVTDLGFWRGVRVGKLAVYTHRRCVPVCVCVWGGVLRASAIGTPRPFPGRVITSDSVGG